MSTLREKRKKNLLKLEFVGALLALSGLVLINGQSRLASADASQLEIIHSMRLPIKELSALVSIHVDNSGKATIAAIGDHNADMALASLDSNELRITSLFNFQTSLLGKLGVCSVIDAGECRKFGKWLSSQWEAVAVDRHNFFAMHEQAGFIAKISRDTHLVQDTVSVEYANLSSDVTASQKGRKIGLNSLGEGLVLLEQSRILIAKQNNPAQIIEFGVLGDIAQGYSGVELVSGDSEWKQKSRALVPLHSWTIPERFKSCDINEMTFDRERNLYILSKICKLIMKVAQLSPSKTEFSIEKIWELPSRIAYAEGLVALPNGRFLIGEDIKTKAPNLFLMASKKTFTTK